MLSPYALAVPTALCRWLTVLARILADDFPAPVWHLVIDDTLVPRTSRKAPGVGAHFDHSKAGMVKRGLAVLFRNVDLASLWDRKSREFRPPEPAPTTRKPGKHAKAA